MRDCVGPDAALDPRIRQAIATLQRDFAHDIDIHRLTRQSGLSRAYFFTLFQRATRVTPLVYANVLRFEAAIERLSLGRAPVAQVAYALGFSAPGHFARFFRQHLGISPTDYRRAVNLFEPATPGVHTAGELL